MGHPVESADHFFDLLLKIGVERPRYQEFVDLGHRYRETARRRVYTLSFLRRCADLLSAFGQLPLGTDETILRLALFYHRILYTPGATTNAQESAEYVGRVLAEFTVPEEIIANIGKLIRATAEGSWHRDSEEALISDIHNAALLSLPLPAFQEQEQLFRDERRDEPGERVRADRRKALDGFAERPRLFFTPYFF